VAVSAVALCGSGCSDCIISTDLANVQVSITLIAAVLLLIVVLTDTLAAVATVVQTVHVGVSAHCRCSSHTKSWIHMALLEQLTPANS
jgi:hypothetical protein